MSVEIIYQSFNEDLRLFLKRKQKLNFDG